MDWMKWCNGGSRIVLCSYSSIVLKMKMKRKIKMKMFRFRNERSFYKTMLYALMFSWYKCIGLPLVAPFKCTPYDKCDARAWWNGFLLNVLPCLYMLPCGWWNEWWGNEMKEVKWNEEWICENLNEGLNECYEVMVQNEWAEWNWDGSLGAPGGDHLNRLGSIYQSQVEP